MKGPRNRRQRGKIVDGILLLDKSAGISSNDALQRTKRLFEARKAGHTGNLDPLATGLLPICFGEATKVCQFLLDADKTYLAKVKLGANTTTGDAEGEIVRSADASHLTRADFSQAAEHFVGEIKQTPPMYSAIKHQGQPLYKLARQGVDVPREARDVTIYELRVCQFADTVAEIEVRCSKGTYIRTLAEEIGERLECGAHLTGLRRLGVGPFELKDAATYDELSALDADERVRRLQGSDLALERLPALALSDDAAYYVRQGQAVTVPSAPAKGLVRLYDEAHEFVGVGEVRSDGTVGPKRLFAAPSASAA